MEGLEPRGRVNHHATTGSCAGFFAPLYKRICGAKDLKSARKGSPVPVPFYLSEEEGRKRDREGKSSNRVHHRPFLNVGLIVCRAERIVTHRISNLKPSVSYRAV